MCSLCNESMIEFDEETQRYVRVGEPTEAALKILVEKIGHPDVDTSARQSDPGSVVQAVNSHYINAVKKLETLEFSRDRKSMSVLVGSTTASPTSGRRTRSQAASGGGGNMLYVKGAPEGILVGGSASSGRHHGKHDSEASTELIN